MYFLYLKGKYVFKRIVRKDSAVSRAIHGEGYSNLRLTVIDLAIKKID
jgi:hypothetical protein